MSKDEGLLELEGAAPHRRRIWGDGQLWSVFQLVSQYDRRQPRLVFESETTIRTVRSYPANWHTLDDAALYALSLRT